MHPRPPPRHGSATSRTWHPKYPHWRSGHISDLASKISPLAWHARVVEEDVVALVRLLVLQWGRPWRGELCPGRGKGADWDDAHRASGMKVRE